MDWLVDAQNLAPFFLWVDSFTPHELWDPPPSYADYYFANDGSLKDFIHPGALNRVRDPSPAQIERTKALYAGSCTLVDKWIGHLLEAIDDLGLADQTIVMFVTDHGVELWDDGEFTKRGAMDGKLHAYNTQLNWFIRYPSGPRGTRIPALVQNHDLLPTILSLLEVPGSELFNGKDAWQLVSGKERELRSCVVTGWGNWAAVRHDRWNCVLNPTTPDGQPKLFDLHSDPDEKVNIADRHPDVVRDCRRYLEGLIGAPFPVRFKHQPEAGDYMTLSSFFKRRAAMGMLPAGQPAKAISGIQKSSNGSLRSPMGTARRKSIGQKSA
jgi:arylsulfatase A-like enzyme